MARIARLEEARESLRTLREAAGSRRQMAVAEAAPRAREFWNWVESGGIPFEAGAIRTKRQQMGLDISDLATLLGMSSAQVSRLERGQSLPAPMTLAALVYILRLDVGDVFRLPAAM